MVIQKTTFRGTNRKMFRLNVGLKSLTVNDLNPRNTKVEYHNLCLPVLKLQILPICLDTNRHQLIHCQCPACGDYLTLST